MATTARPRILAFDGLRGIAALAVVLFHCGGLLHLELMPCGYLAVDLFFILSGFVVDRSYTGRLARGLGLKGFLMLRLRRLYPLFLLGIVLGIIRAVGALVLGDARAPGIAELLGQVAFNGLMLPDPYAARSSFPLNTPSWSLFFEMVINAVFAAGLFKARSWVLAIVSVFGLALMVHGLAAYGSLDLGWKNEHLYVGLGRACFGFPLGVLLSRRNWRGFTRGNAAVFGALSLVALFALSGDILGSEPVDGAVYDAVVAIVLFPIVIAGLSCCSIDGWLGRASVRLGDLSYAIYAVHYPMLLPASRLAARLPVRPEVAAAIVFSMCVAAGTLAALADLRFQRWLSCRALPGPTGARMPA